MGAALGFGVSWGSNKSAAGPSPALWGDCPPDIADPNVGSEIFQDFLLGIRNTTDVELLGFKAFIDTSDTIQQYATEIHGVLEMATAATDNNNPAIATGGDIAGCVKPYTTTPKKFWLEARIKTSVITEQSLFFGLAAIGCCANNGLLTDTTGALQDKDCIGFHVIEAAPATVNAVYKDNGQTAVEAGAAVHTLVADTYVKLGLRYSGKGSKCLTYYVDGVEKAWVTATVAAATGFPNNTILAVLLSLKTGSGAARKAYVDWLRVATER